MAPVILSGGDKLFKAAVIGAGPAGLAAISMFLSCEKHLSSSNHTSSTGGEGASLLWVDTSFEAGRLSAYSTVPSNTKVKYFTRFAKGNRILSDIYDEFKSISAELQELEQLDAENSCDLKHAAAICAFMTKKIIEKYSKGPHSPLNIIKGTLATASYANGQWNMDILLNGSTLRTAAKSIVFSTGSEPKTMISSENLAKLINENEKLQEIHLDAALSIDKLNSLISKDDVVAVIGSSHSAVLVLKFLSSLKHPPKLIKNFYRAPFKYAVYMPDDWILYDNTGLKGVAAEWTKNVLEKGLSETKIERIHMDCPSPKDEYELYVKELGDCTKIVASIGYQRSPLPRILLEGVEFEDGSIFHDPCTSELKVKLGANNSSTSSNIVPNCFGFGIGFPEKTTDRHGNVEDSVGLWKFMKYANRVFPEVLMPKINES